MSDELAAQLARLDERSADLAETADLPRGALPALFRALAAAPHPEQERALARLAERWPDWPLATPQLAPLLDDLGLTNAWAGAVLALAQVDAPWCAHRQAAALLSRTPEDPGRGVRLLALLLAPEPSDPTPLALELGVDACLDGLLELLQLRLRTTADRRDRTSARLAQGAIRALGQLAADDPRIQREVSRVVAAEARRAGKGEPTLALEALDALAAAPPIARIRLLTPALATLASLKGRKVRERAEALRQAAADELHLGEDGLAELTARSGGLERDGVARLPLDEGQEASLRIGRDGEVAVEAPPELDREDTRALEAARRELEGARAELARRLELALQEGRCWSLPVWRAVFLHHPLWGDLARRLTWELETEAGWTGFDLGPGPRDVLGDALELPAAGQVRLAHPAELDPDELELWRERAWERSAQAGPAPFPQLFRATLPPEADPFARFSERQATRDDVAELARRSGWRGYPLEGKPPWELYRGWPDGGEAALELFDVPPELARTALGNLTKEARKLVRSKQAPPPEVKPRVRLGAVTLRGELSPRATAEVVLDLERLVEPLGTPSELELRAWQKEKWREPKESWRALVLRYRQGSPAALAARRALLLHHLPDVRLEDRFAITRQHVIELGSGVVHEGAAKDYLPAWKVAERAGSPELSWPFAPAADPATVEVVSRVVGLAAWEQAQPLG